MKCQPDADGCIDLLTVLRVINQVNQEQVWAICYELATLMRRLKPANCAPIEGLAQIHLHKDGYVHEKSCSLAKLAGPRSSASSSSSSSSSPSSSLSPSSSPVGSGEDSAGEQSAGERPRPIASSITTATTTSTPTTSTTAAPSVASTAANRASETLTTTCTNSNRTNRAQPQPTSQLATTTTMQATTATSITTTTNNNNGRSQSNNINISSTATIAPDLPQVQQQPPTPPITPDQLNQILGRRPALNETELVASLGIALFWALDYGIPDDEERKLNMAMEYLIFRSQSSDKLSLDEILDICQNRLSIPTKAHASSHYREVCRTLINDTIELSIFLEKIYTASMVLSDISLDDCFEPNHPCDITDHDLSQLGEPLASLKALRINDWARLWMQVIRELRQRGRFKQALAVS